MVGAGAPLIFRRGTKHGGTAAAHAPLFARRADG